mgnify:FL=1
MDSLSSTIKLSLDIASLIVPNIDFLSSISRSSGHGSVVTGTRCSKSAKKVSWWVSEFEWIHASMDKIAQLWSHHTCDLPMLGMSWLHNITKPDWYCACKTSGFTLYWTVKIMKIMQQNCRNVWHFWLALSFTFKFSGRSIEYVWDMIAKLLQDWKLPYACHNWAHDYALYYNHWHVFTNKQTNYTSMTTITQFQHIYRSINCYPNSV